MPCFNSARYVGAAIDSALKQSHSPARIIVIDDGSTDGSEAMIRSYGARVEYFHQSNGGPASARNSGLLRTQAEYVAFLDADDIWTPDSLESRLRLLVERPEIDGVFAALSQFLSPELVSTLAASRQFDPTPSVARFPSTLLVRRKSFQQAGLFDASLRVGEMLEWVARAEAAGLRFELLDHLVLMRRIHDSNSLQRAGSSSADYLKAIKGVLSRKRSAGDR
jgi:glycosyltransferase involved in cell wall biosynthesis